MNTIGSHPGAILFRLTVMVILITIVVVVFFSYIDDAKRALEARSVQHTQSVIESALVVVFSTYAVKGELDRLNQIDGCNPFVILREFQIQVAAYERELDNNPDVQTEPGWYYLSHRGLVLFRSYLGLADRYFRVELGYRDNNASGAFEAASDNFDYLKFVEIAVDDQT